MANKSKKVVDITIIDKEASLVAYHHVLHKDLQNLDLRIRQAIARYHLDEDVDKLFSGYTPTKIKEIVVPIQTVFTRADLLLLTYEAELRWKVQEYGLDTLGKEIKRENGALLGVIREMRRSYVQLIGANVFRALTNRLLEFTPVPETSEEKMRSSLDWLLLRYFGTCMEYPTQYDSPVMQELDSLLSSVGKLTGCTGEVENILGALHSIND